MRKRLFIVLLLVPVIFNNYAFSAEKTKKGKANASQKKDPAETMGFQDILFGTSYDVVKAKLETKYPDIFNEKNGNIILGDLSSFDKVSKSNDMKGLRVFKIGDIYSEVKLLFDKKNNLCGYEIISSSGDGAFKSMKGLAEVIAYKFGSPDFTTTVHERNLINTVALGQSQYVIGYAWLMGRYNAYIGLVSYYQEGYSRPFPRTFAQVIRNADDVYVKPCFKRQYAYETGDVSEKASQF